ncbi:N-alpha-acetyl-L-2,4-diaminobutyric acid deacetylase [Paraburkholderia sediminicola]|uniref:N-alpha-acetyl-L-2,4-diaminobutyric acid deacetylase n=1 Tax=Paraburkholderia sediminicola TaxID=458836 RepID=A0A6J4ZQC7_9BURK|nr:succinylglutamate desuccinylase/aspartoacylase family protein [Paraburkholderia sediminicola]CAB3639405.1 N-alpha-acetyl-L-2,4-diaminobutyric acid deacetylase [Paraburkholderia sediminicola]
MATDRSRISTDIDFDKNGFQTGTLRVPHSVDRSAYGHIPIPIAVLKNGGGPTALLTGGNHGDEYEGPIALMKLLQRMPSMQINGRLIVVPGLNFPAFLAGRRTSPIDGANMNRIFPGRRDGSVTEMIAHYVDTELFPRADFVFDIHAGGASFDHLPTLLVAPPADPGRRSAYQRIIDAFASPYAMVMDLLGEDRTYGAAIERHGKLFLCGEFGGYSTCNPDGLAIVEEGLQRVLSVLGIESRETLPPPRYDTRWLSVQGERHYVFSSTRGIFEPTFRIGDAVKDGQLAGRVFDPHAPWAAPVELRFRGAGTVMVVRSFASVEPGDCVALIASSTQAQ